MTPHTFRLLSGGAPPSSTTEVRLRLIESTTMSVENTIALGWGRSDYVFVSILACVMETYLVGESLTPLRYY